MREGPKLCHCGRLFGVWGRTGEGKLEEGRKQNNNEQATYLPGTYLPKVGAQLFFLSR